MSLVMGWYSYLLTFGRYCFSSAINSSAIKATRKLHQRLITSTLYRVYISGFDPSKPEAKGNGCFGNRNCYIHRGVDMSPRTTSHSYPRLPVSPRVQSSISSCGLRFV